MSAERCQEILQTLLEYSLKPNFDAEMKVARELYIIATGQVNDDDPFYEQRMASFQEFFVFDYRLHDFLSGSTLFEHFLCQAHSSFSLEELCSFEQLRTQKHSLFHVIRFQKDELVVEDLLAKVRMTVFPLPNYSFNGFDGGQIFEARMVNFKGTNYFTGAFIMHPRQVKEVIYKEIDGFLEEATLCEAKEGVFWKAELAKRDALIAAVEEQKQQTQQVEKKRAIDMLKITKKIAEMPRTIVSKNLIMALGSKERISPYVPEMPLYNPIFLLQKLANCEVKSYRYRHIDPIKIYEAGSFDNLSAIDMPKIPVKK